MIESKSQRLEMISEDDNLSELVDKKKVKELQKLMREWQTSVLASLQGKDYP